MKKIKSSIEDLREIFEKGIKASHIAEAFCSFDESAIAQDVKKFLDKEDYDVIGIRSKGTINGYAYRRDLAKGQLFQYFREFDSREKLSDTSSITEVLEVLYNSNYIFILSFNKVAGIITRGDLQKMPIRMWLFSLISLIEMQMLRIIREQFPEESWDELITNERKKLAKKYFKSFEKKNAEIDLTDCLQLCDKREIISNTEELLEKLHYDKKIFTKLLKDLETLRNNLAHSQVKITTDWPKTIELSKRAEIFLKKCESINGGKNNKEKN